MNLHIGYNSELYYTGHIGCRIKEEHRRKGYAMRSAKLLLPLLKAHGMTHIILTNNSSNAASMSLCEKLGAKYLRTVPVPEWHFLYKNYGAISHNIYVWDIN